MISVNKSSKYPLLIIREEKYGKEHYLAQDLKDVFKISLLIIKEWLVSDELFYFEHEKFEEIDLLNEKDALLFPWKYAPNTKLDFVNFIVSNIELLESGETPVFSTEPLSEKLTLKFKDVNYWYSQLVIIINKNNSNAEYTNVSSVNFTSLKS